MTEIMEVRMDPGITAADVYRELVHGDVRNIVHLPSGKTLVRVGEGRAIIEIRKEA